MTQRDKMSPENLSPSSNVADVPKTWPETIPVFMEKGLDCVGCIMAPFDTLSDVA